MNCQVCLIDCKTGKDLSNHIKKIHGMSSEDYTVNYIYAGSRPACKSCGSQTRYTAFTFKKYCTGCADVASREGGKKGGKAQAWNKGKTAREDQRIAFQAKKFTGIGNPFFGKRHNQMSLQKISQSRRINRDSFYQRIRSRSDISADADYDSFVSRNEKNIECNCENCGSSFTTSLAYLERDFMCPHCHERVPPFKGKTHTETTRENLKHASLLCSDDFSERIKPRETEFELLTPYEEYFSRQKQYLKFRCKFCDTLSEKTLQAYERGSLCRTCFPQSSSRAELEIGDFIVSLGVQVKRNDRKIISPKEIDILVPEKCAGFEYDGLYWHSEMTQKSANSQSSKTLSCLDAGISLFRIYSDQWDRKRDVISSMIKSRLGLVDKKIPARKCTVLEIDQLTSREFLERNHLYGSSPAKKHFALSYEGKIVSIVSMRVPRQKKHRDESCIEVCRFATELNTIVVGGFSKIFAAIKSWARVEGFKKILTYADLDTGTGGVYAKSGFTLVGVTGPTYWYTDGEARFDRFKFRAGSGKAEKDIAKEAGVYRVYGAGSRIYMLDL